MDAELKLRQHIEPAAKSTQYVLRIMTTYYTLVLCVHKKGVLTKLYMASIMVRSAAVRLMTCILKHQNPRLELFKICLWVGVKKKKTQTTHLNLESTHIVQLQLKMNISQYFINSECFN